MDPLDGAQDVVHCTRCKTLENLVNCEICHLYWCKGCAENHYKIHHEVPIKQTYTNLNYPRCRSHSTKQCKRHCEQCDVPICEQCEEHSGHEQVDILIVFESKKEALKRELKELEELICPKYQEIASNLQVQKVDLSKNSKKLITALNKRGMLWQREINTIVRNLQSDIEKEESKRLDIINKQEYEITLKISEITENIDEMKKLLNFRDISLFSEYKSRNAEFKILPPKFEAFLPKFTPPKINRDRLSELFGSLSDLSFTIEGVEYSMSTKKGKSTPPDWALMDVPLVITTINTSNDCGLYGVTCLNDEKIWTCGNNKIMELYNLQGRLVKSIQTESGNRPQDIAVTKSDDLVYIDDIDKTVNIVKNTYIETMDVSPGWIPRYVCGTSSDDLLVVMDNAAKQTRVVRYSGTTEKQIIQFHNEGHQLYSSGGYKYISENRNLDICVSDYEASAVVVVNQAGKLRFNYTGPSSTHERSFFPSGITTDSRGRILTADCINQCIHILDQDGQFLRYIDNSDLLGPFDLSVDTRDNLFVVNRKSEKTPVLQEQ